VTEIEIEIEIERERDVGVFVSWISVSHIVIINHGTNVDCC